MRSPLGTTAELLADSLDLEPEDRARLLAAASRIAARHLVGSDEQPAVVPRRAGAALVGRARELQRIERHLSRERMGALFLTGEPGIGKTRLLQEAATLAAGRGYTVLQAGCQRHSARQAYAPLIDAVTAHLEQLSSEVLRRVLEGCDRLVCLMPELADAGHVPPLAELPPEQERRLAFRAMGRLLRRR